MGISKWRDEIATWQSLLSAVGLAIGAAWVLYNFDFQSERVPQLSLTQDAVTTKVSDELTLLKIADKFKNSSKSTGRVECVLMSVQRVLPMAEESRKILVDSAANHEIPSGYKFPQLYNLRFTPSKTVPAASEASWEAYIFVAARDKETKELNRLLAVETKIFDDVNCRGSEKSREVSLVDLTK